MDPLQKRQERFAEHLVIQGAATAARRLELHILYTARGAGQSRQLVRRPADVLADHRLQDRGQVQVLLLEQFLLLGALRAEVLDLLLAVDDLGHMHRCRFSTQVAYHFKIPIIKNQIPNKSQNPILKHPIEFWSLNFGPYSYASSSVLI